MLATRTVLALVLVTLLPGCTSAPSVVVERDRRVGLERPREPLLDRHLEAGERALEEGRFGPAVRHFEAALRLEPGHERAAEGRERGELLAHQEELVANRIAGLAAPSGFREREARREASARRAREARRLELLREGVVESPPPTGVARIEYEARLMVVDDDSLVALGVDRRGFGLSVPLFGHPLRAGIVHDGGPECCPSPAFRWEDVLRVRSAVSPDRVGFQNAFEAGAPFLVGRRLRPSTACRSQGRPWLVATSLERSECEGLLRLPAGRARRGAVTRLVVDADDVARLPMSLVLDERLASRSMVLELGRPSEIGLRRGFIKPDHVWVTVARWEVGDRGGEPAGIASAVEDDPTRLLEKAIPPGGGLVVVPVVVGPVSDYFFVDEQRSMFVLLTARLVPCSGE